MGEPLELVDLPDTLRAEIGKRLVRARAPLGPLLASRLRRDKWRFWTLVPEGFYEPGMSLDYPCFVPVMDDPIFVLSQRIEDFLRRKPGRTVIFENDRARKDDPWLKKCAAKRFFVENHTYLYARSGDSAAEIEEVIRRAGSASWDLGMVVDASSLNIQEDMSRDDLREFALKAVSIICDAFDGVSFVVAELSDGMSIAPDRPR